MRGLRFSAKPKIPGDTLKPFADRLLQFTWAVRKVADADERLALDCFEEGLELMTWLVSDTKDKLTESANSVLDDSSTEGVTDHGEADPYLSGELSVVFRHLP